MTDTNNPVLTDLLACCRAWDEDVRILGNIRAGDAAAAIEEAIAKLGQPAASEAETLVRYCPGCGSIGPVEGKYRDCCPDGSDARMIPQGLAEKCRETFKIAIKKMMAEAAANDASGAVPVGYATEWKPGWTAVYFDADIIPPGTPVYAAPAAQPEKQAAQVGYADMWRKLRQAQMKLSDAVDAAALLAAQPAPSQQSPQTRLETTSEHIARDIREGRFPNRSEPQRVQSTEWGPMPDAGTESDFSQAPVAHVAGNDVSRYLEWDKNRSAWERPIGTPVYYAAPSQQAAPAAVSAEPANPDKCNADVFTHGVSMGVFGMTKQQAEAYCKAETARTGRLHDWHYVAGRVHVKALIAQPTAATADAQGNIAASVSDKSGCLSHSEESDRQADAQGDELALPTSTDGRDPIIHAVASLAAAISLLERTPNAKKVAASDKMFDQMLADYRVALKNARAALAAAKPEGGNRE